MPLANDLAVFAGWEGTATPEPDSPGLYRVEWRNPRSGMPELVDARHLSFRIRKFSKRFGGKPTLAVGRVTPTATCWHAYNRCLSLGQWPTWQEAVAYAVECGYTVSNVAELAAAEAK
jgi:hypothetical protein